MPLPIVSILIFMPLVGVTSLLFTKSDEKAHNAFWVSLWTTLLVFFYAIIVALLFDSSLTGFQFVEERSLLGFYHVRYIVGLDGISLAFVLLTTFLMVLVILASFGIRHRRKEYMIAFLIMETFMLGVFCALDSLVFYMFFEVGLIPMFLIIGIWGGKNRVFASLKFFLYTLLGSVFMLLAVVYLAQIGKTDMRHFLEADLSFSVQRWLWLAFFASFAVKIPKWPVHTWLPDAHVQAPTAGSMILAGILLKMGAYGFLRFSLPLCPEASIFFAPLVIGLGVIAIVVASLSAFRQEDMKKLVAYSSVAHMGFVSVGLFSGSAQGAVGAMVQMISHGCISAALFFCVGSLYDRTKTRNMNDFGGLAKPMPLYGGILLFFLLASAALPGTSGFVGEFLVLISAWHIHWGVALLVASGVILGAVYPLWLYRKIATGPLKPMANLTDCHTREKIILLPLVMVVLWLGLYPKGVIKLVESPLNTLMNPYFVASSKQSLPLEDGGKDSQQKGLDALSKQSVPLENKGEDFQQKGLDTPSKQSLPLEE